MKFTQLLRAFIFNILFFGSIVAAHNGSGNALIVSKVIIYGCFIIGLFMFSQKLKDDLVEILRNRPYAKIRTYINLVLSFIAIVMLIIYDRWFDATIFFFHISIMHSAYEKAFDTIEKSDKELAEKQKSEITPNQF